MFHCSRIVQGRQGLRALTKCERVVILSIDSACKRMVIYIKLSVQSKTKDVIEFLNELKRILKNKEFNLDTDLTIIKSKKKDGKVQYSTPYTLVDLDYDANDVAARLGELTLQEYSETLVDKDDINPPLLFVFGKDINEKQVYIKLKIKGDQTKYVLCVSFHYAEEPMRFPYA